MRRPICTHEVGAAEVAALTKRMGITSDVPNYPSISLGAYEASVFDMVGAYSAFVNQGTWIEPTAILRIEDKMVHRSMIKHQRS
jgi:penicillin-binding protein 1A